MFLLRVVFFVTTVTFILREMFVWYTTEAEVRQNVSTRTFSVAPSEIKRKPVARDVVEKLLVHDPHERY